MPRRARSSTNSRLRSGIIGNVTTYEHGGKQYVAILSGIGGFAGIGLAAGLTDPTAGLGAVGRFAGTAQLYGARRTAHRVRTAMMPRLDRSIRMVPEQGGEVFELHHRRAGPDERRGLSIVFERPYAKIHLARCLVRGRLNGP